MPTEPAHGTGAPGMNAMIRGVTCVHDVSLCDHDNLLNALMIDDDTVQCTVTTARYRIDRARKNISFGSSAMWLQFRQRQCVYPTERGRAESEQGLDRPGTARLPGYTSNHLRR